MPYSTDHSFYRKHLLWQISLVNIFAISKISKRILSTSHDIFYDDFQKQNTCKINCLRLLTIDMVTLQLALSLLEVESIMIMCRLYKGLLYSRILSLQVEPLPRIICWTHLNLGATTQQNPSLSRGDDPFLSRGSKTCPAHLSYVSFLLLEEDIRVFVMVKLLISFQNVAPLGTLNPMNLSL